MFFEILQNLLQNFLEKHCNCVLCEQSNYSQFEKLQFISTNNLPITILKAQITSKMCYYIVWDPCGRVLFAFYNSMSRQKSIHIELNPKVNTLKNKYHVFKRIVKVNCINFKIA